MSVAVVKLGVGNTASVLFALERLGVRAELTDDPARVAEAERVILPGVGAAAYAARVLRDRGLDRVLCAFRRPLLGICLGQQLLFERSEEGDARGLGLLAGEVTALPNSRAWPSPHMGWSRLTENRKHPLLDGVGGAYAYFVHSFACPVDEHTLASAEYERPFAAAVARDNVLGCQFHPERSGAVGARVLANFMALPC
ncbi:MAG: imidazole glycerol phosphate synthase subunit HisH [Hyphomonadaceae bacterium]